FKNGITKAVLKRPATINDGILELSEDKAQKYANIFDTKKDNFKLTKFVPASGAATRMFKFLIEFLEAFDPEKETVNAFINRRKDNNLKVFLVAIEKFPFYNEIAEALRNIEGIETWKREHKTYAFIKKML